MADDFSFRDARRGEAKPLIGIYAESGCGKTYSALILARGFVGPAGRIGMIETESGRGESYADVTEYPEIGGYQVLPLRSDFSPSSYGKAISAAERAKLDCLIIDSASHEWEGIGGVLDMADKKKESGAKGVLVWQQPKIQHQREFMLRVTQTPIPLVILCMRAKYPMVDGPNPEKGGKKELHRSSVLEPTQSADILHEMFVHGWIDRDHNFHPTRITNRTLQPVFPRSKPLTLETGRMLAEWAKGNPGATSMTGASDDDLLTTAKATAKKGTPALEAWWATLTKEQKLKLADAGLRRIAEDADAGAYAEENYGA